MLNAFINLHTYLILNTAIAASYLVARSIFRFFFKKTMSQIQQLQFVRYAFVIIIVAFCIAPVLTAWIHIPQHSNFILQPILKNKSIVFLQNYKIIDKQVNLIAPEHLLYPIDSILIIILLAGCAFFLSRYIKNIVNLHQIKRNSFCRHRINTIHILFSQTVNTPFCWSFIKSHNIVIPSILLERNDDLKLAVSHELQHIRQKDTYWIHFINIIRLFCFWNPFIKLWINWFNELQEFSCDEAIIIKKKKSPATYAQCLINALTDATAAPLPYVALGIHNLSKSIIYRRLNMLFSYKKSKTKKISMSFAYITSFLITTSVAYAFAGATPLAAPLSTQQVANIIKQAHLDSEFNISATPEVVNEINNIRNSDQARSFMHDSLQRMKQYQPTIQKALADNHMPNELLAVPLVESGYRPLDQNKNPVLAAGIWQIVPKTAEALNLVVNTKRDDRFDTTLATKAALTYLKALHEQFNDWKLALIAYEIGEQATTKLISSISSRDAWVLARSPSTPKNYNLEKFIPLFDAAVIIMHNPSIIAVQA
jgi:membrane-bound lytic murein transglycosylase D